MDRLATSKTWTRPLKVLRAQLDAESDRIQPRWAWRLLPHGACVAAQRLDGIRTIRISREKKPPPESVRKWEAEVSVFRRELQLEGWEQRAEDGALGIAITFSCALVLLCERCGRKMSESAPLFGDGCIHCARPRRKARAS